MPLAAQPVPGDKSGEQAKPASPGPEEKSSITHHALTLDSRKLPYTATAGNLKELRDNARDHRKLKKDVVELIRRSVPSPVPSL